MTWKGILTFLVFFVSTPILLGQVPGESSIPTSVPSLASPSLPALPTLPATPALNATDLQGAGLNTGAMGESWGDRARQNQESFNQGLPQAVPSSEIPSPDASGLANRFAQELFPQEYNASRGQLNNIPQTIPSSPAFPSTLPTPSISSIPTLPSTPTPTPPSF